MLRSTTMNRTLRGKVVVAGIGETTYYKHGQSPEPEFKLAAGSASRPAGASIAGSARLASRASGVERGRAVRRRARRAAARRRDPHARQPGRRSTQRVQIGAAVEAVFEQHDIAEPPDALVQWRVTRPQ